MLHLANKDLLLTHGLIDGEWVPAESGSTFDITNPSDGSAVAAVADMGVAETRLAIEAADSAMVDWKALTAKRRAAVLKRWHALLMDNVDDLGLIMSVEMGKPLGEAKGEVAFGAGFVEWFAEEGKRAYGEIIPTHDVTKRLLVIQQPIGVVAAITPWNFPLAMITRKVAPALAAGCSVVVKPAEDSPLTALAVARLGQEAGIPPGVLNVITTSDPEPVGHELSTNPIVRKLSFTGSIEVGRLLMRNAADTIKSISLELGGNAPFIVFDDADLDAAVEGAIASKYRNSGQTCICANRLYVQDGVYDEFAKKFAEAVSELRVGPAMDDSTAIGPLVNEDALTKVEGLVADALASGASVLTGGERHSMGRTYYEVTVLANVTQDMRVASEEIFGPVAPLYRFETEPEVVEMANDTNYGLAAYFYAGDAGRIFRVGEALEYGMIGVNTGLISTELHPFGGVKESGIGREGSHHGLTEYLETKYLCIGGL